MMGHPTMQEDAWGGDFGTTYTKRQKLTIEARAAMFRDAIGSIMHDDIKSVIEFGAGAGDNLRALRTMMGAHLTGVEINPDAFHLLKQAADLAIRASVLTAQVGKWDLVLTRGLLIHVAPANLDKAYDTLHRAAGKYILICEYFSPQPRMIPYRGRDDMLWARDFAGEMLDRYDDLTLVDYGFVYDRDPAYPQDNVTWFWMERER